MSNFLNDIEELMKHAEEHALFRAHSTLFRKAWGALEKARSRLSAATEYEILPAGVKNGHKIGPVFIRRQLWPDGVVKWSVYKAGWVLDRDGDFVYEPIPSKRSKEFLQSTRFDFEEAWERASKVADRENERAMRFTGEDL